METRKDEELEIVNNGTEIEPKKNVKEELKKGLSKLVSEMMTSAILGVIGSASTLLEKLKIKKDGETKWYKIVIYLIFIGILTTGITFATEYSTQISQYIIELLNF